MTRFRGRLPEQRPELVERDRLEKNVGEAVRSGLAARLDVGGDEIHRQMREFRFGTDGIDQFPTVHFGHPEVGKHDVESGICFQLFQRLPAVFRHRDIGHAAFGQHGREHRAVDRRVVDDEHAGRGIRLPGVFRSPGGFGSAFRRFDGPAVVELYREGRAHADFGNDGQLSPHERGELPADGQSEARAVAVVLVGDLDERLEDALEVRLGDAFAGILDLDRQRAADPVHPDRDRAALRVLVSIRQQIEEQLADAVRIHAHPRHFTDLGFEFQRFVEPGHLADGDDFAGERRDVRRFLNELQLAAFHLREVEDVVHEARQHLAARADGRNAAGALRFVDDALFEQFRKTDDGVEGRADVVRHGREEEAFGLIGRAFGFELGPVVFRQQFLTVHFVALLLDDEDVQKAAAEETSDRIERQVRIPELKRERPDHRDPEGEDHQIAPVERAFRPQQFEHRHSGAEHIEPDQQYERQLTHRTGVVFAPAVDGEETVGEAVGDHCEDEERQQSAPGPLQKLAQRAGHLQIVHDVARPGADGHHHRQEE